MRNFPWMIGALLVVLIAGGIGFWLGVGANAVPVAAPVAGAPVVYAAGWHFGFPFFGFFFFLLFMFVIFAIIRRVAWGGHRGGRGWYGPTGGRGYAQSGWSSKDVPPMADDMLQRWHRRAHGEPDAPNSGTSPDSTGQGPSNSAA